jgi:hypothetical protein
MPALSRALRQLATGPRLEPRPSQAPQSATAAAHFMSKTRVNALMVTSKTRVNALEHPVGSIQFGVMLGLQSIFLRKGWTRES